MLLWSCGRQQHLHIPDSGKRVATLKLCPTLQPVSVPEGFCTLYALQSYSGDLPFSTGISSNTYIALSWRSSMLGPNIIINKKIYDSSRGFSRSWTSFNGIQHFLKFCISLRSRTRFKWDVICAMPLCWARFCSNFVHMFGLSTTQNSIGQLLSEPYHNSSVLCPKMFHQRRGWSFTPYAGFFDLAAIWGGWPASGGNWHTISRFTP